MGAEIAARVTEQCFYHLEAPVLRVGGYNMPYPPSRIEEEFLPDLDRVLDAVDRSLASLRRRSSQMALREFKLPDLGEGLTEAEIVTWHVAVGDTVKVNDIVVEIETAKSLVELPSPFAGIVAALHVAEGDDRRGRHRRSSPSTTAWAASPDAAAPARRRGRGAAAGPRPASRRRAEEPAARA